MSSSAAISAPSDAMGNHTRSKLGILALVVGLIGLAIGTFGLFLGLQQHDNRPLFGWLLGFGFWFSIGIGMIFLVQMFYIFDAGWPITIRRQLEHALSAFPWLFLALVPLVLTGWGVFGQENAGLLWKWLDPHAVKAGGHAVAEDPLYLHKQSYLNREFFTARVALYALVFCGLSALLRRCSFRMDTEPDTRWVLRARKISAAGIILCALATTFAAFDLFMSLSYEWFSTMYGVWFFATSIRAGLAATVILGLILAARGHLKGGLFGRPHLYMLGCMSLAFTIFWAYISFSQYFLIYNANIPEETFWYNIREFGADGVSKNSWWWVSLYGVILGYFLIPFLYLLGYRNKVISGRILFISAWILVFHIVDLYFNILPSRVPDPMAPMGFRVTEFSVTVWDLASIVGLGGLCVWAFLRSVPKAQPIPIHDPRILESIHYHE